MNEPEAEWVARLTLPGGSVAELTEDGVWRSADADLAALLDVTFSPRQPEYAGPGAGAFGRAAACAAARALEARLELADVPPPEPGRIY